MLRFKGLIDTIKDTRKVICITGGIGEGKTIAMSTIAHELKNENNAILYSNYKLKDAIDSGKLKFKQQKIIVCLDEIEYVLQHSQSSFDTLLEFAKEKDVVILFTSFSKERLPGYLRKEIDVSLSVNKDRETSTVELRDMNGEYKRVIKIDDSAILYDAFVLPNFNFEVK